MSVATDFPARTDANGTTWYRPVRDKGMDLSQWGWTADPAQAHPDYAEAATLCTLPPNVTAHDRAAVLEFQNELIRRSEQRGWNLPSKMTVTITDGPDPDAPTPDPNITIARRHQEDTLTELTLGADGEPAVYEDPYPRRSEICGFPLPPFPEQVNVEFDGWKRYKLPSPTTGKLTAYTRATTVASVTPDDYNLVLWKIREKVRATQECYRTALLYEEADEAGAEVDEWTARKARAYYAYTEALDSGKGRDINNAIDVMHDLCGGAESREHGGAVHDWIAEVDMGRCLIHQVPPEYRVHVDAYQEAMARAGLIAIPDFTERLVLNTRGIETIAGRLDGIAYCVETGKLHVMDRKTSKTLDFSALEFGVQVAGVYSGASLMLEMDRSGWVDMPEVDTELAFIVHVPSDQPERSQVVPLNIPAGAKAMDTALEVRAQRRNADKTFFGGTYEIPSQESLRYVQAWQRIQNLQSADDAAAIMQEYEDVWDDALAEFGQQCYELLNNEEEA